MEQIFFKSLFALLKDKQAIKITTTRVGDKLTLLINIDSKLITMTGTPEEVDNAIMDHLKVNTPGTEQKFNVTVSEAPKEETEAKPKPAAPAKKKAPVKKAAAKATVKKPEVKKAAAPVKKTAAPVAKKPMEKKVEALKQNADKHVAESTKEKERKCRVCGCTQDNCEQCIKKTGEPCHWVEDDLCSACVPEKKGSTTKAPAKGLSDLLSKNVEKEQKPTAEKKEVATPSAEEIADAITEADEEPNLFNIED